MQKTRPQGDALLHRQPHQTQRKPCRTEELPSPEKPPAVLQRGGLTSAIWAICPIFWAFSALYDFSLCWRSRPYASLRPIGTYPSFDHLSPIAKPELTDSRRLGVNNESNIRRKGIENDETENDLRPIFIRDDGKPSDCTRLCGCQDSRIVCPRLYTFRGVARLSTHRN